MTSLPERFFRLWRRATPMVLAVLLAACGPGTGGTGTGPISFSGAGTLAGAVAGVSAADAVTAAPALPCGSCTRLDLRLDDGQIELRLPCGRFVFTGPWSAEAPELALSGTFERAGASGTTSAPATLRLQFGTDGSRSRQVAITLVDAAGAPVVAATLQRGDGVAAPDSCSP